MNFAYADPPYPGRAQRYYYRSERGYRGVTTCGRLVPAEQMGSFDGQVRVTCRECMVSDVGVYEARRRPLLCDFERRCVISLAQEHGLLVAPARRALLQASNLEGLVSVYAELRSGRWPPLLFALQAEETRLESGLAPAVWGLRRLFRDGLAEVPVTILFADDRSAKTVVRACENPKASLDVLVNDRST